MNVPDLMTRAGDRANLLLARAGHRRMEDVALDLLYASQFEPSGDGPGPKPGAGPLRLRGFSVDASGRGVTVAPPAALGQQETAALLDVGGQDAMLIVGAAVHRIARGETDEELVDRALSDVAAWRRERIRVARRQRVAEEMLAYVDQLIRAESEADVYAALSGSVTRIVGAYAAVVLTREPDGREYRPASTSRHLDLDPAFAVPADPGFRAADLLVRAPVEGEREEPAGPLAPLFADPRVVSVAHYPVGELGIVCLVERRIERVFEPEDWELLRTVCAHAGNALERLHLLEEVRQLSLTDPLTGLANRRHLKVTLQQAFAAAHRGEELTVVMIDVNGFKAINDEQGHLQGDRILCLVANALRQHARASDLVARYGGDEFVLVLPGARALGAELLLRRVRFQLGDQVRLSAGIAEYSDDFQSVDDLIEAADKDLYLRRLGTMPHLLEDRGGSGSPVEDTSTAALQRELEVIMDMSQRALATEGRYISSPLLRHLVETEIPRLVGQLGQWLTVERGRATRRRS